jgi:hypothetical protein
MIGCKNINRIEYNLKKKVWKEISCTNRKANYLDQELVNFCKLIKILGRPPENRSTDPF